MLRKYKEQIIMEITNILDNYRIIIKKDNLFDDYIILSQKYKNTNTHKNEILPISIYDLHKHNYIDLDTNLRLLKIVNM